MNVIIPTIAFFVSFLIGLVIVRNFLKSYLNKKLTIMEHERYHLLLNYYLELAYDSIWKDQMMVFISNEVKPGREDLETMARNFTKLVSEMMGPRLVDIFIDFHGSESTFWTNIITYFNFKIDNDEIETFMQKVNQTRKEGTSE